MNNFFAVKQDNRTDQEKTGLREKVLSRLIPIVGKKWVTSDPLILDTYAWQYLSEFVSGEQFQARPLAVVLPENAGQVAQIIRACKDTGCKYKAFSTGFGAWAGVVQADLIVQIDLKRLDRIIEIDKENMIAVIEPWVTGNQLQSEAMKLGLNTHMAGVGGQASVLASATSMMGQGWDGVTMGFSDRNLLGVEWVLPDGEIARLGSFDASGSYFAGDGPGISLRGAMRGFGGAMGGLGVFTKCAVKLYPWYGPKKVEVSGRSPNYWASVPKNATTGLIVVDSWDKMSRLGYELGEAEIMDLLGRNAPALITGALTVDNNEFAEIYKIPMFHEMYYTFMFVLTGRDETDYKLKLKTLKKIVKSHGGGLMIPGYSLDKPLWLLRVAKNIARKAGVWAIIKSLPGFAKLIRRDIALHGAKGADYLSSMVYGIMVRNNMNMRGSFKYGGSFHTSMGSLVSWDSAIRGAKIGEQIKKRFIKDKVVFDDGGDNAWGGLYEGGAYAHLEELALYDPRDPHCREHIGEFLLETNLACIENACGDPINAIGPPNHLLFSPACGDYDDWQQKIKKALDPENLFDASMYTDADFKANPPEQTKKTMETVQAKRTKIIPPPPMG